MKKTSKNELREFNGFWFDRNSPQFEQKRKMLNSILINGLRKMCEIMSLNKEGSKVDLIERILDFLLEPRETTLNFECESDTVQDTNEAGIEQDSSASNSSENSGPKRRRKKTPQRWKQPPIQESPMVSNLNETSAEFFSVSF